MERSTRAQSKSQLWHKLRAGHVTASHLHEVCHTNPIQPAMSLTEKICNKREQKLTEAMKWGQDHEEMAKDCYQNKTSPS